MGEYADMAVDHEISFGDRYDDDGLDEDGEPGGRFYRRGAQPKTCKRCGQGMLLWKRIDGGWRLHELKLDNDGEDDGLKLHVCPAAPQEPEHPDPHEGER